MAREKKATTKKSPTKRIRKTKKEETVVITESKIGKVEKMGDIYRKFVTEDSFIIGNVIGDEFIPFK